MTRKEFWEWMRTCPVQEVGRLDNASSGWFIGDDNGDDVRIFFYFDIDEDENDQANRT